MHNDQLKETSVLLFLYQILGHPGNKVSPFVNDEKRVRRKGQ